MGTYPGRLRKEMMNLNRMVCICYPEYNVPWFHDKFCIEQANSLQNLSFSDEKMHLLRDDVYETLCSVVGGNRNIRENVYTPYYHFIDLEVWLNTNARTEYGIGNSAGFLPIGDTTTAGLPQIRKVASGTNLPTEISRTITEGPGNKIEKYAILIHRSDQYIINTDSQLSGEAKNFIQQLQTLKYKV